jgi:hypothetical protein
MMRAGRGPTRQYCVTRARIITTLCRDRFFQKIQERPKRTIFAYAIRHHLRLPADICLHLRFYLLLRHCATGHDRDAPGKSEVKRRCKQISADKRRWTSGPVGAPEVRQGMDARCGDLPQFGGDRGPRIIVRRRPLPLRAPRSNVQSVANDQRDCFDAQATAGGVADIALCRLPVPA